MASEEHLLLSSFIKETHVKLRIEAKNHGFEETWAEHCKNINCLEKYATKMQKLATEYWAKNKLNCRINWILSKCSLYFLEDEKQECRKKELKYTDCIPLTEFSENTKDYLAESNCIDLLDVGSCYNPFKRFKIFNVTAIDIAPANEEVIKCDFLTVPIVDNLDYECEYDKEIYFYKNMFDAIVFSLLLEYIPSPEERYKLCVKAFTLLRSEGILFIITPDSKHITANSVLMKSWKIALANLGFHRVYYQKLQHLHCMGFRKSISEHIPKIWAAKVMNFWKKKHPNFSEKSLLIPQDETDYEEQNTELKLCESNDNENLIKEESMLVNCFTALPFQDIDNFEFR